MSARKEKVALFASFFLLPVPNDAVVLLKKFAGAWVLERLRFAATRSSKSWTSGFAAGGAEVMVSMNVVNASWWSPLVDHFSGMWFT